MQRVAIIGAGPAGSALAFMLHQRGFEVLVYDNHKKPDLMVGESLLPAVIPILQRLGIEEKVAKISTIKRGAALCHGDGTRIDFEFQRFGREYPNYAYNIPRPQFDQLLRDHVAAQGVKFIDHQARIEIDERSVERQVRLSSESLQAAGLSNAQQPDLIVDASGRSRVLSRLLDLPVRRGPRNDVAHFAHFQGFSHASAVPGQVLISVLDHGWSWQIPLKDKTSVGVVLDQKSARHYGATAKQRLSNVIDSNPLLSNAGHKRKPVSPVMTYSNYQQISEQASGPGWILLGDALGFVDPMLSPGVFMTLQSAVLLDEKLSSNSITSPAEFSQLADDYQAEIESWHTAWSTLIEYFYDGRMLALGQHRDAIRSEKRLSLSRVAESIISRSLAQMVGGVATRSAFNQKALYHSCKHLVKDASISRQWQIRSIDDRELINIQQAA